MNSLLEKIEPYAPAVLLVGLAFVVVWFGVQQLLHGVAWAGFVPAWTSTLGIIPLTAVYANGTFEVVAGILLALGLFVRPLALLLFLHLVIIIVELGLSPTGVRDIGLAVGFLTIALTRSAVKKPQS